MIGALKNNVEIGARRRRRAEPLGDPRVCGLRVPPRRRATCSASRSRTSWTAAISNAQICTQPSDIQTAVTSFTHPDVSLPEPRDAVALGTQAEAPKQPKLKRARDLDARPQRDDDPGLARDTSYKLGLQGFHTVQLPPTMLADAPPPGLRTGRLVYYDAVQPNAEAGRAAGR